MNAISIRHALFIGLLGIGTTVTAAPIDSAQDQGNRLACCLASEWTAPDTGVAAPRQQVAVTRIRPAPATGPDTTGCQQEHGGLSCCLAREWTVAEFTPGSAVQRAPEPPARPAPAPGPDTSGCQKELGGLSCCIGAEWRLSAEPQTSRGAASPDA